MLVRGPSSFALDQGGYGLGTGLLVVIDADRRLPALDYPLRQFQKCSRVGVASVNPK
jgi:hypothetical protein